MSFELYYVTIPEQPDGDNNWFVSPANLYLVPTSGDDVLVYWRWNSSGAWSSGQADAYVMVDAGYLMSGSNTLNYYASGAEEGRTADYATNLYFDDVAPTLTVTSPTSGSWYGDLSIAASGSGSSSDIYSMDIYMDNWLLYTGYSGSCAYTLDTTAYSDGTHFLDVGIRSNAGWLYSSGMTGIIDNNPPAITVLTPPEGTITTTSYTVSGEASDAYSNIDFVQYSYYLVNSGSDNWAEVTYTSGENTTYALWYAPLTSLVDGVWLFKLRASDEHGNITPSGAYDTYSFLVASG